jgi:hypothetical protein
MSQTISLPTDRATVVRRLIVGAATGDVATVRDLVTDDVTAWSPNLFAVSRDELLDAIADRDGALTNVDVTIYDVDMVGSKAVAEWRAEADFTGPLDLGDGVRIEPTGRRCRLAGATFAEFDGERVSAFRQYFDDAALLEQLLGLE